MRKFFYANYIRLSSLAFVPLFATSVWSADTGCVNVAFSAVDPRNSVYYLTGHWDHHVYVDRGYYSGDPSEYQAWELRETFPVPTDTDPYQPSWLNVFWLKSEQYSSGVDRKERNGDLLFLSLSDEAYKGDNSLVLYPAQLGYYANVNARIDFEISKESDLLVQMVLRNTGLYIVPDWKSRSYGRVLVSVKLTPGDFPGWRVISWRDSHDCSGYLLARSARKFPWHPVY